MDGKIPNEFEWPLTLCDVTSAICKVKDKIADGIGKDKQEKIG